MFRDYSASNYFYSSAVITASAYRGVSEKYPTCIYIRAACVFIPACCFRSSHLFIFENGRKKRSTNLHQVSYNLNNSYVEMIEMIQKAFGAKIMSITQIKECMQAV